MKKILTLALFFYTIAGYSQNGYSKITIIDNIGRKDSVVFGQYYLATNGIDANLGELNIIDKPMDSLEIRSILRDENSHLCLSSYNSMNNGVPIFFTDNLDLKRDFRYIHGFSNHSTYFEFKINVIEYPFKIIGERIDGGGFGCCSYNLYIIDENCNVINSCDINALHPLNSWNNTAKSIVFHFDLEVGIKELFENSKLKLYPNPISDNSILEINNDDTKNDIISLYTPQGKLVFSKCLNGANTINIDKTNLNSGLYYLKYMSQNGYCETIKVILE